eukprot:1094132-Rhodomonas_salina.1
MRHGACCGLRRMPARRNEQRPAVVAARVCRRAGSPPASSTPRSPSSRPAPRTSTVTLRLHPAKPTHILARTHQQTPQSPPPPAPHTDTHKHTRRSRVSCARRDSFSMTSLRFSSAVSLFASSSSPFRVLTSCSALCAPRPRTAFSLRTAQPLHHSSSRSGHWVQGD